MFKLDAIDLLDLSEAGALLLRDPARLRREIRLGRVPAARVAGQVAIPLPWAESAAGIAPTDEPSVRTYWLARLAPPSATGHRPLRERGHLEVGELLDADEVARRLCAHPAVLPRLMTEGTLPALKIDGTLRFDAVLVDLLARAGDGEDVAAALAERHALISDQARFDYETGEGSAATPSVERPPARSLLDESPPEGALRVPRPTALPDTAKAYELPADLLSGIEPPSTLIEADGFETIDED
jgi:hypothetical protein